MYNRTNAGGVRAGGHRLVVHRFRGQPGRAGPAGGRARLL